MDDEVEINYMSYSPEDTPIAFLSTKTFPYNLGLSCVFRQWRAESHCKYLHGYALQIKLVFYADELDCRNWVVDYGSLKSFKQTLQDSFDHKTIVAQDDPELDTLYAMQEKGLIQLVVFDSVGCEKIAEAIFYTAELWLKDNGYSPRVKMFSVTVSEHEANSAIVVNKNLAGLATLQGV